MLWDRTLSANEQIEIELSWIHSIEKTPWREIYSASNSGIVLKEVFLKSYGAGTPADLNAPTKNENGYIHTFDIDQPIPQLNWSHSHDANYQLRIDQQLWDDEIPDRAFIQLEIINGQGKNNG